MPGLSIHVVDVARGVPAAGLRVELFALDPVRTPLAEGTVDETGATPLGPIDRQRLSRGRYEAVFHVGDYFRAAGVALLLD